MILASAILRLFWSKLVLFKQNSQCSSAMTRALEVSWSFETRDGGN